MRLPLRARSRVAMSGSLADTQYCVAEWYRSELDQNEIDYIAAQLDEAAAAVGGAAVRRVMTVAIPVGEWMFTLFEAACAETVEEVFRRAGVLLQQLNVAVGSRGCQQNPHSSGRAVLG
jgi:hypothetical protein